MSDNLDRFDRMLLAAPLPVVSAPLRVRPVALEVERQPVITSERGPKYVDYATCPMCGVTDLGIEYQGELRSGAKLHTISAHTAERRRVERGMPRCLGAKMFVVFEGGAWKGASAQ